MHSIDNLIEGAKARLGLKSERELANHLGLKASSHFTRWRKGHYSPTDEIVCRLAAAAGVDAVEALVDLRVREAEARAGTGPEPVKRAYRELARRLATALPMLILCLGIGSLALEQSAHAVTPTARNLYIMRIRRWFERRFPLTKSLSITFYGLRQALLVQPSRGALSC